MTQAQHSLPEVRLASAHTSAHISFLLTFLFFGVAGQCYDVKVARHLSPMIWLLISVAPVEGVAAVPPSCAIFFVCVLWLGDE